MDTVSLGIEIDTDSIEATTKALERLGQAAAHAREELARLGEIKHGGLEIVMVGDVMKCIVKPVLSDPGNAGKAMADHVGAVHVSKTRADA